MKIGVSCNPEKRKGRLPCVVSQYYCTEPIENAFDIERFMHKIFSPKRMGFEIGREYFEVDFRCACDVLNSAIESTKDKRKQAESAVCELCLQDSDNQKFDKDFYGFVSLVLSLDAPDLALIIFIMKGLEARTYLKNKKSADKAREKELQGV